MAGFLTLDSIPVGRVSRVVNLPDSQEWLAQFLGNFEDLFSPEFFEPYGALTPAEMTAEWFRIFLDFAEAPPMLIPPGLVSPFAGSAIPAGWLRCDGSAISRTTYAALFAAIGTVYGQGDGDTTFDLPLLGNRIPVAYEPENPIFGAVGAIGGAHTHMLTLAEMPVHTHVQNAHNHTQDAHAHTIPGQTVNIVSGAGPITQLTSTPPLLNTSSLAATNQAATATNQNAGSGAAHNNMPPYMVLNYLIKT